jgi:DNA-binding YbaB/EbfC family protein
MAGVGKLLKEAAKMQKRIEAIQAELGTKEIDVSSGGGAVKIRVNGHGKFLSLQIDPEFMKEDTSLVQDTLLNAFQEAADKARAVNEEAMRSATAGFSLPGLM